MSVIIEEILEIIDREVEGLDRITVSDLCVGLGYSGARLSTGHIGLCETLLGKAPPCCEVIRGAGSFAGSPAIKLAELSRSWDTERSIVGVATLNALSQIVMVRWKNRYLATEGNFIDGLGIRSKDSVAMVGYFGPFIDKIKKKCQKLFIMERNLSITQEGILPDTACDYILPEADVVTISGTSIVNKSIDHLLDLSMNSREVGVVGPTAGFIPDVLFKRNVSIVGSTKVLDLDRVMQVIKEGGGTKPFKPFVHFMNLRQK